MRTIHLPQLAGGLKGLHRPSRAKYCITDSLPAGSLSPAKTTACADSDVRETLSARNSVFTGVTTPAANAALKASYVCPFVTNMSLLSANCWINLLMYAAAAKC